MSRYKIEVIIKTDIHGVEISRTWDVYSQNGTLLKNKIKSELDAQQIVKTFEDKDYLEEQTNFIKPKSTPPEIP